jgi:citrate synthase
MSAPTTKQTATPPWPGTKCDGTARLEVDGEVSEVPIIEGTEGERALDISRLRSSTNTITLDEGYVNTGSTTSAITYLDGEQGILRYRGYPIEDLASKADYVEVAYLLIYGKLPTADEIEDFRNSLSLHTMIHEEMRSFYNGFPRDAHPMAIVGSVV